MLRSAPCFWLVMYWQLMLLDYLGNWWGEYKNTGSPFPFPFRAFLSLSPPFLRLPRIKDKKIT